MLELLRGMRGDGLTVHGFRSTFRDWAGDQTAFAREVIEHALAHRIKDKAEASYRRSAALEKRRKLMEAWARYCQSTAMKASDNVVALQVKINASRFGYSSADLEHRVKTGDRTAILLPSCYTPALCTPTHPCPNGSGGHLSTPSFTGTAEKPDHGTRYSVGRAPERNSLACGGIWMLLKTCGTRGQSQSGWRAGR